MLEYSHSLSLGFFFPTFLEGSMDILLHPNLSHNSWMQYSTALVNLDPDGNALPDYLDEQKQANCSMHLLWGGKSEKNPVTKQER